MSTSTSDIKCEILSEEQSQFDLCFKLIVIGDCNVGKSSLIIKAIKNYFEDLYSPTVGFEFLSFHIKISDQKIKLQIWDTCGQELYRSLITNFYRNTSLALIVYAINNEDSFKDIDMWLKELRTHASPDVKVFLIGNKIDLENERKVTKEQGEEFSKKNCINKFTETSAKNGINAQSTFIEIAYLLYQDFSKFKEDEISKESVGSISSGENGRRRLTHRNKNAGCGC